MKIEYNEHFLKDLKKLRHTPIYSSLKTLCFEELPVFCPRSVIFKKYKAVNLIIELKQGITVLESKKRGIPSS